MSADTSVRVRPTENDPPDHGSGHDSGEGTGAGRGDAIALAVLAAVAYLPLFTSHRGRVVADVKQYLYLDPGGLLGSAAKIWNPRYSGGTVTHQNIGYLWPTGPYYWLTHALGIPAWVAQRFWFGSILFAAAAGAYVLFRVLWRDRFAATIGAFVYGFDSSRYLDEMDVPPWDTWVALARGPGQYVDDLLISWVPPALVGPVHEALRQSPDEEVCWLADCGRPIVAELAARGLLPDAVSAARPSRSGRWFLGS